MLRSWIHPAALAVSLTLLLVGAGCGAVPRSATPAQTVFSEPPPMYWEYAKSLSTYANGVAVTSLASEMLANGYDLATRTESTPTLVYILSLVAISYDPGSGTITPDLSTVHASDSLGNVYDVTYTEALDEDGLAVGALYFRGNPTGSKTFSLTVGRVDVTSSDGSRSSVEGPWRLDLVEQVRDDLRAGEFIGGQSQEMPTNLGAARATSYSSGSGTDGSWQTLDLEGLSRGKVTIGVFSRSDLSVKSVNRGR